MIVKITIFIADFFKIQSYDSPAPTHGEEEKKSVASQQGTEHRIFRVLFRIRFEIITIMIVQSTTFIADLFKIQVLIDQRLPMESKKKKSVKPRSREQSTEYSELSFELGSRLSLLYNNCAKYHFHS